MGQVDVKCPKCGWEFHASADAVKVECLNPDCGEEIRIGKAGASIDASRPKEGGK